MIGFLIICLATIPASYVLELANELRMFKDLADNDYKINIERMKEFNNKINPNIQQEVQNKLLVPFFNLFMVLNNYLKYNTVRTMIIDQLNTFDCLEEITIYEKNEYNKKPTALNSFIVLIKYKIKKTNSITIVLEYDFGKSEISFVFEKKNNDIVILDAIGPARNWDLEKQKEMIKSTLNPTFEKDLLQNKNEEILNISEDKNISELSTKEKKEQLILLKNELIEENKEYSNNSGIQKIK